VVSQVGAILRNGGWRPVVGDWWLAALSYQSPATNHEPPSHGKLDD